MTYNIKPSTIIKLFDTYLDLIEYLQMNPQIQDSLLTYHIIKIKCLKPSKKYLLEVL